MFLSSVEFIESWSKYINFKLKYIIKIYPKSKKFYFINNASKPIINNAISANTWIMYGADKELYFWYKIDHIKLTALKTIKVKIPNQIPAIGTTNKTWWALKINPVH